MRHSTIRTEDHLTGSSGTWAIIFWRSFNGPLCVRSALHRAFWSAIAYVLNGLSDKTSRPHNQSVYSPLYVQYLNRHFREFPSHEKSLSYDITF